MTFTERGARISRNTSLMIGASIAQKVLTFFYFIFIARVYGVTQTGQYFFALSFSMILSVLADLGYASVLIRETAKSTEQSEHQLRTLLGGKVILIMIAYAALAGSTFLFVHDTTARFYILLAGVSMVLEGWYITLYAVIRGHEQLRYESLGMIIGQTITFVLGGTIMLIRAPLAWLFGALILGNVFHLVWATTIVRRKFSMRPWPAWDWSLLKTLTRLAIPFALAGIFVKIYSYADGVLLGFMIDKQHVGWYSVAYKLTFALQFIPMGFAASLYPAFSALAVKAEDALSTTFTHASHALLLIALPISFGIFSLSDQLIPAFYGPAYAAAIPALRILIFTAIFVFLSFPIGSLLNATHRQTTWTVLMGVSMVVNVALNLILIPRWALVGAATASLVSQALLVFLGLIVIARVITIDWHAWLTTIVRALTAVSAMTTVVIWMKPSLHYTILIAIGAVVYIAALILLRLLRWSQCMALWNSVRHPHL